MCKCLYKYLFKNLTDSAPDIFNVNKYHHILYLYPEVGGNNFFLEEFKAASIELNLFCLTQASYNFFFNSGKFNNVIYDRLEDFIFERDYDIIFWLNKCDLKTADDVRNLLHRTIDKYKLLIVRPFYNEKLSDAFIDFDFSVKVDDDKKKILAIKEGPADE